jgi:arylsulfatase A-like enzyme
MNRRHFLKLAGLGAAGFVLPGCEKGHKNPTAPTGKNFPNIVYILADDLGYGDVSRLNADSKIKTSNIDGIAEQGMVFTDAHSGSSVCTPTRYGILTGRYCWRSRLKSGVLWGYSSHLIPPQRLTIASMLKQKGYHTACIGKWHLGWDWSKKTDAPFHDEANPKDDLVVDFTRPIANGPITLGFDYFFGISASLDMAPYVYVENDRPTALPDRIIPAEKDKRFYRSGPAAPDFDISQTLPKLTEKAVEYINNRASQKNTPFFLYFPLTAPHTPILPTKPFQGKSGTSEYGDFVLQVDWTVGQIINALRQNGLEDNTLVIFTSDNGCSPMADFDELAAVGHYPSYVFRGTKADIFDGGHRIPFIARWPGKIKPASVCDQTICLTDFIATTAQITGFNLPDNAGEDSVSILAAMDDTVKTPLREAIVHHSINGSFAIRQGKWKMVFCPDSGGWSQPKPGSSEAQNLPAVQLYDLNSDIGEKQNLYQEHPDVVKRLTELLEQYVNKGRSTPGEPQQNDSPVTIINKS